MRSLAPVLGLAICSLACGSSERNPNDAAGALNDGRGPEVAEPVAVVEVPKVDEPVAPPAASSAASEVAKPAPKEDPPAEALQDRPAPSFSLGSLTTKGKVGIAPGKVTIVDFWATYCAPCMKYFPKLQALHDKYKGKGLEIASVSVDEDENGVLAFAQTHGAKFPVGWDKGLKVADLYKPPRMPTMYVVDKKGIIRYVHAGYVDGTMETVEAEIKALF